MKVLSINYALSLFLIIFSSGCASTDDMSTDIVRVAREDAQLAVINLNITDRLTTIEALPANADLLFSADVGDVQSVDFTTQTDNQQHVVVLSDNPADDALHDWSIAASRDLPMSFVIDTLDSTLNANLTTLTIPRFDLVAINSTVDITLPADTVAVALDSQDSTLTMRIPAGAQPTLNQVTSTGGLITLVSQADVSYDAQVTVTGGALSIDVPATTGVQVAVQSADNAEISLPMLARIPAEAITYRTENYTQSSAQIMLTATLSNATLRITQRDIVSETAEN